MHIYICSLWNWPFKVLILQLSRKILQQYWLEDQSVFFLIIENLHCYVTTVFEQFSLCCRWLVLFFFFFSNARVLFSLPTFFLSHKASFDTAWRVNELSVAGYFSGGFLTFPSYEWSVLLRRLLVFPSYEAESICVSATSLCVILFFSPVSCKKWEVEVLKDEFGMMNVKLSFLVLSWIYSLSVWADLIFGLVLCRHLSKCPGWIWFSWLSSCLLLLDFIFVLLRYCHSFLCWSWFSWSSWRLLLFWSNWVLTSHIYPSWFHI
jgi:hypothetical protein